MARYTLRESQLIQQAQIWKQEARAANATIAEILPALQRRDGRAW